MTARTLSGHLRAEWFLAVSAATGADTILAELQDGMMPVEVGDRELRDGLAEVRSTLGGVSGHARELLRVLGR